MTRTLTDHDTAVVEAFGNFLSWGERPVVNVQYGHGPYQFHWPPAVFAYVSGATTWCPPKGTL